MSSSLACGTALTALDLAPCQQKARVLSEPVKALQPKVQLVAHPVGRGNHKVHRQTKPAGGCATSSSG
jgi:hypothetical protein